MKLGREGRKKREDLRGVKFGDTATDETMKRSLRGSPKNALRKKIRSGLTDACPGVEKKPVEDAADSGVWAGEAELMLEEWMTKHAGPRLGQRLDWRRELHMIGDGVDRSRLEGT